MCLQELKTEQHGFPASALRSAGYEAVWVGERSWNSVAILAREQMPILTRSELPVTRHARYLEAAVRGVLIVCIYLPNGNPQPGPKFAYKWAWFERLILHANDLVTAGVPDRDGWGLQRGPDPTGNLPSWIFRQEGYRHGEGSQPRNPESADRAGQYFDKLSRLPVSRVR